MPYLVYYDSKISQLVRLMTLDQQRIFAVKCAETMLHIFEVRFPNDKQPRRAIEAAKNGNVTQKVRDDAWDAVWAASYWDNGGLYAISAAEYAARAAACCTESGLVSIINVLYYAENADKSAKDRCLQIAVTLLAPKRKLRKRGAK